jgi:hypothetical protein
MNRTKAYTQKEGVFSTIAWSLPRIGPFTMGRFQGVGAAVLLGITEQSSYAGAYHPE